MLIGINQLTSSCLIRFRAASYATIPPGFSSRPVRSFPSSFIVDVSLSLEPREDEGAATGSGAAYHELRECEVVSALDIRMIDIV